MSEPEAIPLRELVADNYELVSFLGRGGAGRVYLARDITRARDCALKLVPGDYKDVALQEVRSLQRVRHWNVVQLYDAGYHRGSYFLVMELLKGDTLRDLVSRHGPRAPTQADRLLEQVAWALESIHLHGIVHCDVKPDNVFSVAGLNGERIVKVLDFGISQLTGHATAQLSGTPDFMAPEQFQPGVAVTPATDIFAYGLLAYYLLTGRSYWNTANMKNRSNSQILSEIQDWVRTGFISIRERGTSELPSPFDNWNGFDIWLSKCLQPDPGARFQEINSAYATLRGTLRRRVDLIIGDAAQRASSGFSAVIAQELDPSVDTAIARFKAEVERLLPEARMALRIAGEASVTVQGAEAAVETIEAIQSEALLEHSASSIEWDPALRSSWQLTIAKRIALLLFAIAVLAVLYELNR
jgi:serine/threonine protein kinase